MAQVIVIQLLEGKQNPPKSYILNAMAVDESLPGIRSLCINLVLPEYTDHGNWRVK